MGRLAATTQPKSPVGQRAAVSLAQKGEPTLEDWIHHTRGRLAPIVSRAGRLAERASVDASQLPLVAAGGAFDVFCGS